MVEKILTGDEALPREWPVHGTTGYEFLNMVNGLFVDAGGARAIERLYQRLREGRGEFDDLLYLAKRLILRTAMSSELYVLARRLDRISEQHRWSRDFTQNSLHLALAEVIACFPVYRTYTQADRRPRSAPAIACTCCAAIRDAKRRNRSTSESVFDFIADLLLLRDPDGLPDADRAERREFVLRLQQLTGPVMAKGLEDTVLLPLLPARVAERGGRSARPAPGSNRRALHAWNARRLAEWPHGLSATATHDTKRGEDVRARLNVLSEIPREWQRVMRHWQRLNRRLKSVVDDARIPGANEEYLIYQTLIGAWPMDAIDAELSPAAREALRDRITDYMTKALREAKLHTSWINVNAPYEQGVAQFIDLLLQPSSSGPFVAELRRFVGGHPDPRHLQLAVAAGPQDHRAGRPGHLPGDRAVGSVAGRSRQPAAGRLRDAAIAARGAPRAPGRGPARAGGRAPPPPADGRVKLLVTARALQHRRQHRALFDRGDYQPLPVEGSRARHVFAFARTLGSDTSITVVGRLLASVATERSLPLGEAAWGDTRVQLPPTLPHSAYREIVTGAMVEPDPGQPAGFLRLSRAFANLPVAVLEPV